MLPTRPHLLRLLSLMLALALTGCAGVSSEEEDGASDAEKIPEDLLKIVGGREEAGHPEVGVLMTAQNQPFCTGSWLGSGWVLTAAHCILPDMNGAKVGFGPSANHATTTTFTITDVKVHPAYPVGTQQAGENINREDIALLKIQGDPGVAPVRLLLDDVDLTGQQMTPVGFGVSDGVAQTGAGIKRSVRLPVTQPHEFYWVLEAAGQSACFGDSGGPAFARVNGAEFQGGVASFVGDGQCSSSTWYVKVSKHAQWLQQETGLDLRNPGGFAQPDPGQDPNQQDPGQGPNQQDPGQDPWGQDPGQDPNQPPPQNPGGQGQDFCQENGWYGDGICDDGCARPDPDCGGAQPPPNQDPNQQDPGQAPNQPPPQNPGQQQDPNDPWAQPPQNQQPGASAFEACRATVQTFTQQAVNLCHVDAFFFEMAFLAAAGGDCGSVQRIRDMNQLMNQCLPWARSVQSCGGLFMLPPPCHSQFLY